MKLKITAIGNSAGVILPKEVLALLKVEKGDTLSAIAKQFYGRAGAWRDIFEANRDQLDDPDRIFPGQVLKIPAIHAGE